MSLKIFRKHPYADAYKVGASFTPYAIMAKDKRFTDAELAAEYWGQQMEAVRAVDRAYPWGCGEEVDIETARIYTLERFVTLPHFDEVEE